MENRFIILAWRGNFVDTFYEVYDNDDVLMTVNDLKQDAAVEHIEVIPLSSDNSTYRWSNPNSNPE